ncbi:unnamed protein product [Caenorhabditis brenneri]
MVGWSHLPPEIKQHVVKELDFMSRHSLKCTSHTDRQIVNSTPLKIPRVRFGHKGGRCLIVIYTGVEQFLRWELFDEDNGITIQRCENCYDTAEFKRITIQNADSLQVGISILRTLLAPKSIKIDVFECDVPCENDYEFKKKMRNMEKYLDGDEFRATEVVSITFFKDTAFSKNFAKRFCCEVKEFKIMNKVPLGNNIVPCKTVEFKTITDDESKSAIFILHQHLDEVEAFTGGMLEDSTMYGKPWISYMIERDVGVEKSPTHQFTRSEEVGLIKLTYATTCGTYITTMFPEDEQFVQNQLVDKQCGMSWLCQKCADPFEYWYHQNLTMRLIHEPFWAFPLFDNDEPSAELLNLLKQNLNERPKPFKSSWGFERVPPKLHRITAGIPKFFIWFGIIFISCIVSIVVLHLVEKVNQLELIP